MSNKFYSSLVFKNLIFVLLLAVMALGIGYFATRFHAQQDITHNANNSLDPVSVTVIEQMNEPINITVYATEHDAKLGDIRKILGDFISLYQRYKSDLELTFIDPTKEEEKTRAAGIQLNGEMVIEYAGRNEHLTQINEQTVTSTLLRLAHARDQKVMYLDGHGERKLDGAANHDLGKPFGAKLIQNGFQIGNLNLALAQGVPDNVSVLVVTQPKIDLISGEIDLLLQYIERGGNLLWLIDAEPLHGLERLADKLDLLLPPGVVIDPAASNVNAPAHWSLGATYPPHDITRNFNLITVFPSARPLVKKENSDWQHHVLVEVAPRGWVSSKAKINEPRFDKKHDTPGPAIIAMALQRPVNNREQRIVVVGNGAFVANNYAGNGGNVDLGINMVNWLAGEEHLITLQPRSAKDNNLTLSSLHLSIVGIGFLIVVPLLLAGVGGYIWWKRRRT
ncbi:MAG: Gldg family protein [Gallionella sp.]